MTMPDDAEQQPIPIDRDTRITNTIRCANEACKLPLVELTHNRTYLPLHAFPIRRESGTPVLHCTCPACGTDRKVTLR